MKIGSLFIGVSLMATMAVGVGASLSIQAQTQETEAAVTSVKSGEQFFIDCSSFDWYKDGAYIGLYFFGGSSTAEFTDFTQTRDSNNMFRFTVPGTNQTYSTVIALRKGNSNKDWSDEWNRVDDHSIGGNGIKITGWGSADNITVNAGITSGSQVYVNYNAVTWWAPNCDPYMFFCNELNGKDGGWVKMNSVNGTGNDHILECTVPGTNAKYTTMIAARVATGQSPASDWSNVHNQTVDYVLVSTSTYSEANTKNSIVIENSTTSGKQNISTTYSYVIDKVQRAKFYGTYFISQTDATCASKTAPSTATWGALQTEYNHMNVSARNTVKNATASASSSVSYEEAMRRYDLIVSLRGSSNFMNRDTSGGLHAIKIPHYEENTNTIVVVSIVALSLATLFGLGFFIRKKFYR